MAQMKEQNKTSEKTNKQDGNKQSIRCRVQNTGYQDAQGTHWVLQQHKKTQAEMKSTLSETKKNLQGTNSGGDEAMNQINNLEHKEKKFNQNSKKKKEFKKKNEDRLRGL